jgi:hypothetical protein
MLARAAALMLLFAVVGLSTLARNSHYLPKSSPFRHFSKITKMETVHPHLHFLSAPKSPVGRIVLPQLELSATPLVHSNQLTLRQAGLTVCYPHRAPPLVLA